MSDKKKTTKKCSDACKCQAAEADPRKIDLGKVTEAVKKVPQWLVRVQAELEQLIKRLQKLDEFIEKLKKLIDDKTATKDQKEEYKLLCRQRKAMVAYRDVLEKRAVAGRNRA